MLTDASRVPLASRAWIGDGRSGALVTADGAVDWYCPGGFDAPAALYRLLDPTGGAVRVGPVRDGTGARRRLPAHRQSYRPGTLVAETELPAGGARLRLLAAMPWPGPGLTPPGRIVLVATALAGPIDVEVEVVGGEAWRPAPVSAWSEGVVAGPLAVRTGFPLEAAPLGRDRPRWRGVRRLDAGASLAVTIDVGTDASRPLSPDAALRLIDETEVAWRSWLRPLAYAGPYRAAVERAAVVVRSLSGDDGGPLSAPTTSLPRRPGAERAADGRVVRLRDAAAAAATMAAIGFDEDAEASERWLRGAVEGATLPWPAALEHSGGALPGLEELPLEGWRRGQPVVAGAAAGADSPLDLDLYGDVVAAVSASQRGPWGSGGDGPLAGAGPELAAAMDWLADHWESADGGVWSSGRPARLVASAVQAWSALSSMARRAAPLDLAAAAWRAEARRIESWLEAAVPTGGGGLRRDASGPDHADAALLRLAWRGPWPATHPVVAATVDLVLERLSAGRLLHRLADGADGAGPDSPDLLASLWAVRALAAEDRWEEAHERMEAVVALGGDLGLLSEAADPVAGELLGNLPAAAVHLALADAAVALSRGPV